MKTECIFTIQNTTDMEHFIIVETKTKIVMQWIGMMVIGGRSCQMREEIIFMSKN